jgi:hypothetical protein
MTKNNICAGFRACGIWPYDPNAIPNEAYLPNFLHVVESEPNPNVQQELRSYVEMEVAHHETVTQASVQELKNSDEYMSSSDALLLMEAHLTDDQLTTYKYLLAHGFNIEADSQYSGWKFLKEMAIKEVSFLAY